MSTDMSRHTDSLAAGGLWQHAVRLLGTVQQAASQPSVITYNAAITAAKKRDKRQ